MATRNDLFTTGQRPAQLGDFLRSRRARLTPQAVGLPAEGRRRTAGLRREEVARLAGISAAWYTHLEQGRDVHPSRDVLGAVADALCLDAPERAYLYQLAYGPRRTGARRAAATPLPCGAGTLPAPDGTPPSLRRLLDALGPTPALVIDRCWDVAGYTAALGAVFPALRSGRTVPHAPLNLVEYVLTDVTLRAGLRDWATVARMAVDGLRACLADIDPGDAAAARASAIVARLTATSPEFRAWWPAHGLWVADRPVTHVYEHPHVGPIAVDGTMLDVRSTPGLILLTYVPAEPRSAQRMQRLLAAASHD